MLAWRSYVKGRNRDSVSRLNSIATDLFPTPCLNPRLGKEFRSTSAPIMLENRSA
jgi:hypothetical protein